MQVSDAVKVVDTVARGVANYPIPSTYRWSLNNFTGVVIAQSSEANRLDSGPSSVVALFAPIESTVRTSTKGLGVVQLANFAGVLDLQSLSESAFSGVLEVGGMSYSAGKPRIVDIAGIVNWLVDVPDIPDLPDGTDLSGAILRYLSGAAVMIKVVGS